MSFLEVAFNLGPSWLLGFSILLAILFSEYKDLVAIKWPKVRRWIYIVSIITIIRFLTMKFTMSGDQIEAMIKQIEWLPVGMIFLTPWEDLVHTVPIAITERFVGKKWSWIKYPLIGLAMVAFGSGHLYQGALAACLLSLYVPITLHLGKKHGFGTVMLGHVIYDLATVSLIKYLI